MNAKEMQLRTFNCSRITDALDGKFRPEVLKRPSYGIEPEKDMSYDLHKMAMKMTDSYTKEVQLRTLDCSRITQALDGKVRLEILKWPSYSIESEKSMTCINWP